MGYRESKSSTESGVKYISQSFLLQFLLVIPLILFTVAIFFSKDLQNFIFDSIFYFGAVIVTLELIVIIWLLLGFISLYNGRNEFGPKHASDIMLSTILIVIYFVLILFEITLARGFFGGAALLSFAALGFPRLIMPQIIGAIALSILSRIILCYTLIYSISKLLPENKMKDLKNTFILLSAGPLTLDITGLLAYRKLYYFCKEIRYRLHAGILRPLKTAPCPFCDRDIPIESKVCPYCGQKFEEKISTEIDARFRVDIPKPEFKVTPGYLPIKGPTEEEKKRLFRFIAIIIAVIIFVAILAILF